MLKSFDGLSAQVRNILQLDPFSGAVFLFRGKKGRQAEGTGLGWIWTVPVRKTARAGQVRVALDTGWGGGPAVICANGDADQRARLAAGDRARKGVGSDARLIRKRR